MKRLFMRAGVAIAAATAIVLGVSATPASAHVATYGWSDNHLICESEASCIDDGNLVKLWQAIVWAQGFFSSTSAIDGDFGPNTDAKTELWQDWYNDNYNPNISVDGWVGTQTWSAAETLLTTDEICHLGNYNFQYLGVSGRKVDMRMSCSTGVWTFKNPNGGSWIDTSHGN